MECKNCKECRLLKYADILKFYDYANQSSLFQNCGKRINEEYECFSARYPVDIKDTIKKYEKWLKSIKE